MSMALDLTKMVLQVIFSEIPENVLKAVEEKEGATRNEIIDMIANVPRIQIDTPEYEKIHNYCIDFRNHTEYFEETVDTIHDLIVEAKSLKVA